MGQHLYTALAAGCEAQGSPSELPRPVVKSAGMWARLTLRSLGWPGSQAQASNSSCMQVTQQQLVSMSGQPLQTWQVSQAEKLEISRCQ